MRGWVNHSPLARSMSRVLGLQIAWICHTGQETNSISRCHGTVVGKGPWHIALLHLQPTWRWAKIPLRLLWEESRKRSEQIVWTLHCKRYGEELPKEKVLWPPAWNITSNSNENLVLGPNVKRIQQRHSNKYKHLVCSQIAYDCNIHWVVNYMCPGITGVELANKKELLYNEILTD